MKKVCTLCGYVGTPETITPGSIGIELLLWLFFLVPGLLYSLWRHASRGDGCHKCKNNKLVPLDSPIGRKLAAESK